MDKHDIKMLRKNAKQKKKHQNKNYEQSEKSRNNPKKKKHTIIRPNFILKRKRKRPEKHCKFFF